MSGSFKLGQIALPETLGQKMVDAGLITPAQLLVAKVSQHNLGGDLGKFLVMKGFLTEPELLEFMGKELSIPYLSLASCIVDMDLVKHFPLAMARRHGVFPVGREDSKGNLPKGNLPKVVVAMSNPMDAFALEDIKGVLQCEISPALAAASDIEAMIRKYYTPQRVADGNGTMTIEVSQDLNERAWHEGKEKLEEVATGPKVVQTVNQIIGKAYHENASDIHIEPEANRLRIRYRVDGLLEETMSLAREMQLPVVSRIKILAGLDIAERRVPQDGRVRLRLGGNPLDLRISTYPTLYGEKVVMRLLSRGGVIGIEKLGFNQRDRQIFAEIISKSYGILLVTGPTGSGKSTTLYAALQRLNVPEKNIISIEDPIESELPGVNQAQVNLKAGSTFATALRAILRQDPDVIMLGEIRDGETAEIAVRAAITGHVVLSTLHTNTAIGAISRLTDLHVEPFLISSALIGLLAQRLVRVICPNCREPTKLDLGQLGPLAEQPLAERVSTAWHGKGCPACRMSGYSGRVGIFELVPMTDALRKLINARAEEPLLEAEVRRMGVASILEDGLEKVQSGVTTIDEVLRVTQE